MNTQPATLGLAATLTPQGIVAPDYQTILSTLTGCFQQIYGSDAYLAADSKDGQMLGIYALALHDANNALIDCYNAFSPATATGAALSNNVAINGIWRAAATRSGVDLLLTGEVGTVIEQGVARCVNGCGWALPAGVVIGTDGTVTASAVCQTAGAVSAAAGTIQQIATPTRGWYSVSNPAAAAVGRAAEEDAALRTRQRQAVALPSRTVLDGILAAVNRLPGVVRSRCVENDGSQVDENGLLPHSFALIADGGDAGEIARAIALKKTPGTGTSGTTLIPVTDSYGIARNIRFSRPVVVQVLVRVTLVPLQGYTTRVADSICRAVAGYINRRTIGEPLLLTRLYTPANLPDASEGNTFDIISIEAGRSPDAMAAANLPVTFTEALSCHAEDIEVKTQ